MLDQSKSLNHHLWSANLNCMQILTSLQLPWIIWTVPVHAMQPFDTMSSRNIASPDDFIMLRPPLLTCIDIFASGFHCILDRSAV